MAGVSSGVTRMFEAGRKHKSRELRQRVPLLTRKRMIALVSLVRTMSPCHPIDAGMLGKQGIGLSQLNQTGRDPLQPG